VVLSAFAVKGNPAWADKNREVTNSFFSIQFPLIRRAVPRAFGVAPAFRHRPESLISAMSTRQLEQFFAGIPGPPTVAGTTRARAETLGYKAGAPSVGLRIRCPHLSGTLCTTPPHAGRYQMPSMAWAGPFKLKLAFGVHQSFWQSLMPPLGGSRKAEKNFGSPNAGTRFIHAWEIFGRVLRALGRLSRGDSVSRPCRRF